MRSSCESEARAGCPAPALFAPRPGLQQALGNQAAQQRAAGCPALAACPTGGACHPCPIRVQAKLRVGQPGDRLEQEADRVADQVLTSSEPAPAPEVSTAVRPPAPQLAGECVDCDEEVRRQPDEGHEEPDQDLLPTMRAAGAPPPVQPSSSEAAPIAREGGQPLPEAVRAYFEPRFSRDLGHVRLHTDAAAAQAARSIGALAYTLGDDIVFAAGQFAPQSMAGRRLLAHELTHTLQQSAGTGGRRPAGSLSVTADSSTTVRRAVPGTFTVSGLYPRRAAEPDYVFFEWNEPDPTRLPPEDVLDPAEKKKVDDKAAEMVGATPPIRSIELYGFASEEGTESENRGLIWRRLTAVSNLLKAAKFGGAINSHLRLRPARGQIDYRFWRCVEMRPDRGSSKRVGATGPTRTACGSKETDIEKVRDGSVKLVAKAIDRLDRYIGNPADEPDLAAMLDDRFDHDHSVPTARDVRSRLDGIRTFLEAMKAPLVCCGDDKEPTCPTGTSATKRPHVCCGTVDEPTCRAGGGAAAIPELVMFCPGFFTDPDLTSIQPEIVIHESAHGSGFRARDRAYRGERVILLLDTRQTLDNAESLTLFVLQANGQLPSQIGPKHTDDIKDCDSHKPDVEKAIAWAARWNTYAIFGLAQTYGDRGNEARMGPFITARFGRTDRPAMAGIYDRYKQMDERFDKPVQARCLTASDSLCSGGTLADWVLPDTLRICPDFFSLPSLDDQIKTVYGELAVEMSGVTAAQKTAYPELAHDYMVEYWKVT